MKKITFPKSMDLYNQFDYSWTLNSTYYCLAEEVEIEDLDDQQDPSNLAEIDYVIEGDKVRIVKLRNFKSLDEIFEQFGMKIGNEYFGSKIYMEKQCDCNDVRIFDDGVINNLQEGQKISKVKFECLIPVMKKAGNRLHNLIKQSKKIRTVKI